MVASHLTCRSFYGVSATNLRSMNRELGCDELETGLKVHILFLTSFLESLTSLIGQSCVSSS